MTKRNLLLAALLAASGTAAAEDGPHSFAGTLWATSDYVFRGVSQTDESFTFQGAFDYSHESGFYAGAWISGVDFGVQGPDYELDTYVGFGFPITDALKGDVQVLRYNYLSGANGSAFEYNELIAKLTFADFITGTIGYSNDVFNGGDTGIYYALSAKHAWESGFTVFGGAGYYDLGDTYEVADGYVDWNLGVSQTFGPVELALTYTDTDDDGTDLFGRLAGNHVFASAKFGF